MNNRTTKHPTQTVEKQLCRQEGIEDKHNIAFFTHHWEKTSFLNEVLRLEVNKLFCSFSVDFVFEGVDGRLVTWEDRWLQQMQINCRDYSA